MVDEALRWLFDTQQHDVIDEWMEDHYYITLRRPTQFHLNRWLDGGNNPALIYRMTDDLAPLHEFLNDWRGPARFK